MPILTFLNRIFRSSLHFLLVLVFLFSVIGVNGGLKVVAESNQDWVFETGSEMESGEWKLNASNCKDGYKDQTKTCLIESEKYQYFGCEKAIFGNDLTCKQRRKVKQTNSTGQTIQPLDPNKNDNPIDGKNNSFSSSECDESKATVVCGPRKINGIDLYYFKCIKQSTGFVTRYGCQSYDKKKPDDTKIKELENERKSESEVYSLLKSECSYADRLICKKDGWEYSECRISINGGKAMIGIDTLNNNNIALNNPDNKEIEAQSDPKKTFNQLSANEPILCKKTEKKDANAPDKPTAKLVDGSDPKNFIQGTSVDARKGVDVGGGVNAVFGMLYKIVLMIVLILMIIVEMVQMLILLLLTNITAVLFNLSPNAPFLTAIAVPLSITFANLANLLMGFLFILTGSQVMMGITKTKQAIDRCIRLSIYVIVSNFVYQGLAFVIGVVDGFAQLVIKVFAGGDIVKLFYGLFSQFASISELRESGSIFPDLGKSGAAIGGAFSQPEGLYTALVMKEAIIIIMFLVMLWIFKDIFVLVLTRSTILLLFLITSPILALAFLVKDILPSSLQKQVGDLPNQIFTAISFNLTFVIALVLCFRITQVAQESFKSALKTNTALGGTAPTTPTAPTAMLDTFGGTVTGSAQAASGLSQAANGLMLSVVSIVPVFIALCILYFIVKFYNETYFPVAKQALSAVGNGVGGMMNQFGKEGSLKKSFGSLLNASVDAATGGGMTKNLAGGAINAVSSVTGAQQGVNAVNRVVANQRLKSAYSSIDDKKEKLKTATGNDRIKLLASIEKEKEKINRANAQYTSSQGPGRKSIGDRMKDLKDGNYSAYGSFSGKSNVAAEREEAERQQAKAEEEAWRQEQRNAWNGGNPNPGNNNPPPRNPPSGASGSNPNGGNNNPPPPRNPPRGGQSVGSGSNTGGNNNNQTPPNTTNSNSSSPFTGMSKDEAKAHFKREALKWHPDKNQDPGAEEQFKKLNNDWEQFKKDNNMM